MTDPRAPLPATVRLVVDEYVRTVRHNDAVQAVLTSIQEDHEVVYELVETACEMGYFPRTNQDQWWTALQDALPQVAEALR